MKKLILFLPLIMIFRTTTAQVTEYPEQYIVERFIDSTGREVVKILVPGKPPKDFRMPVAEPTDASNTLSNVPGYDWCFGCSATSAAMMTGYYDRTGYSNMYAGSTNGGVAPMDNSVWGHVTINGETRSQCPFSATRNGLDGRTTRGHVDDYWVQYLHPGPDPYITNGWTQHTYGDCTGDYMKTSQSAYNNNDGSTWFYNYTNGSPYSGTGNNNDDGMYGIKLFFQSRGYTVVNHFNQYIYGYNGNTLGFTFNQFKQEIDAGRPVLIQVSGHTMLGYGYNDTGSLIYLRDTWDYSSHSMTWGGSYSGMAHYAVGVISLQPVSNDPCASVISINGCGSGYSRTYTGGGNGAWYTATANPCGYTTPGIEQVYSFVAPYTGIYSIQVTAANGYVDYLWRASSCSSSGWTCIDDINSPGQYGSMSWTAGTTYYILLDDEDNATGNHTFYINCPTTCLTCPSYDFSISPSTSWNTHSSSHVSNGCKMYRMTVTSGRTYTFKTGCGDGATATYDTYLELYNSSCSFIIDDDDACESNRSKIEWTANYSGYAYLKVRGYSSNYGNYTLAYSYCTVPAQPGNISGNTSPCQGSSQTYSISSVSGATSYSWSLPSGWSGSSSSTSITTTVGSSGGTISVTANNSCGSSPARTLSVSVITIPPQPGAISGPTNVSSGSTVSYSISAVSGATSYTWAYSGGGTPVGSGTSITLTPTSSGILSVTANNACGSSTARTLGITVTTYTPIISISTSSLPSFGNVQVGNYSTPQSYTVSGTNLTTGIVIWAPAGFQISLSDNSGFTNTLSLSQSGGIVPNTTVYARFSPTVAQPYSASISHTSADATTQFVSVSGVGISNYITLNPEVKNVTAPSGGYSVTVSSNVSWVATETCSWVSITNGSGSNNGAFNVTYAQNTTGNPRSCTITVSGGSVTVYHTLNQSSSNVPVTRNLQNITLLNGQSACYDATETINVAGNGSYFVALSGSDVTMISGESIFLMPETMVVAGSDLLAYITTTGLYCGQQQSTIVTASQTEAEVGDTLSVVVSSEMFKVYPNPTRGRFTLELSGTEMEASSYLQVYSPLGTIVINARLGEGTHHLFDLSAQQPGIYIVRVIRGEQVEVKKLIRSD